MHSHADPPQQPAHLDLNYMLEPPQRRLLGRISGLFWAGAAGLQISYNHFYGGHGALPASLFVLCVTMTLLCEFIHWDRVPARWLIGTFYVGVVSNAISAIDFGLPQILAIQFAISAVFATFYWSRRWMLAAHMIGIYTLFVVASLGIGGGDELPRVLIGTPIMLASALFIAFTTNNLSDVSLHRDRFQATVTALVSALQARDGYTAAHSRETLEMVISVADELGVDASERQNLSDAALLHDIGKIGIPNYVLHKNGPLDDDEWELMRQHPVIGEQILAAASGFEQVAKSVRHEHERWDGGGYPDGISGEDIPLASRIVLACDAYHAMTSDRPYRKAMDPDHACAELIKNSGSQFDPNVADALISMIRRQHDSADQFASSASTRAVGPSATAQKVIQSVTSSSSARRTDEGSAATSAPIAQIGFSGIGGSDPAQRAEEEQAHHLMGRIGGLQWILSAVVAAAYIFSIAGIDVVGVGLILICLAATPFSVMLHRMHNPTHLMIGGLLAISVVVTAAASYYAEPAITMFMLMPASYIAYAARTRLTRVLLAVIATITFVVVPLAIGGRHQLLWVPNAGLGFIATVMAQSYLAGRIPAMQFDRRRFASTATSLLVALGARDGYTAEHSEATVDLATEVAIELRLDAEQCGQLMDVALLHDVGKIGVPNEILLKPGKLTEAEWTIMRQHPVIGEQIVCEVPGYKQVAKAIRHEHERWDGDGYPDGLVGTAIPLASRIVLACDAFHAMTTDRPYRSAMSVASACDELRVSAGSQLDPEVVEALLSAIERDESGDVTPAEASTTAAVPATLAG